MSELGDLAADLAADPLSVGLAAEAVVGRGCFNIKNDWKEAWTGLKHAPDLPAAISYDVTTDGSTITGEVGPDKDRRQGPLGNIIEFGTANNAPRPGGQPALDREEERFVEALGNLVGKRVRR